MRRPAAPFASLARVAMLWRVFRVVLVRTALLLLPIAAIVVLLLAIAWNDSSRLGALVGTALAIVGGAALLAAGAAVLVISVIWKRTAARLGALGSSFDSFRQGTPSPSTDRSGRKVIEVDATRADPGERGRRPTSERP